MVVVTSCRCGTLPTTTGSSVSSAPARIGSAAFFAPEMRTSPSSAAPPAICSLSMRAFQASSGVRASIDSAWISRPMRSPSVAVDELMARQAALAGELLRHDPRGEMGVVVGFDADLGARQAGADQLCDFLRDSWVSRCVRLGAES